MGHKKKHFSLFNTLKIQIPSFKFHNRIRKKVELRRKFDEIFLSANDF